MEAALRSLAILLSFTIIIASEAKAVADELDEYAKSVLAKHHVPGMAIAVIRKGKPEIDRHYGNANLEAGTAVTKDTVFRIASVSKQFSTAAVLLLVSRGTLALDDKVSKYIDGLPAGWGTITVRHLLTATSGIRDVANDISLRAAVKGKSFTELLKVTGERPLLSAPGEKWSYSNTGFVLLSEVVSKASGKPYQEFVRDQLFEPLEMKGMRKGTYRSVVPHRAAGYTWGSDKWMNVSADDSLAEIFLDGAGEMMCSLADLIKWEIAFPNGRVVKPETIKLLQTGAVLNSGKPVAFKYPSPRIPGETSYGMGCFVGKHNERRVVWTPGSGFGFSTTLTRFPDDEVSIVVLCNVSSFSLADEVARGIADRVIPGSKGTVGK